MIEASALGPAYWAKRMLTVENFLCSVCYMMNLSLRNNPSAALLPASRTTWPPVLAVMAAGALAASAQNAEDAKRPAGPPPDKSGYHLFHPTPRALMREMSTDRPDQTESPYTVDAGHFQLEMDLVSAVFDRDKSGGGDVRTTGWGTSLNLKAGLLNNVDIQFVLDPYVSERVEDRVAGTTDKADGVGDLQTRLKVNLWGNDGGKTAFGIMPFIKWPLPESGLRNGKTEGGMIFVLGFELPGGWGSAVMNEYDFVSNGAGGYDTEFVNSITFGHDIVGKLGGYLEFFSVVSSAADSKWQGQVDVGFTYGLTDDIQFDLGCNFGVTKSAPDFNPFAGLSFRF
jgi:hypothetical protein